MNMVDTYNSLDWHDTVILAINIDRRTPGENDSVSIDIQWPDGKENKLLFSECYMLDAQMNFGIIAEECIMSSECIIENDGIESIRDKWISLGVELDDLHCFSIITISTNSLINIYALSYELK